MERFRRIQWFRPTEEPVSPMKAENCTFPFDYGCSTVDAGGCQVSDICDRDNSTCSLLDECGTDSGGGCFLSDLCGADAPGPWCVRDTCDFDDPYCTFLDFGN